ncbi:MAG: 50S ribosomal protein L9 [Proteobacteria bacterium]|nr:50S ribosomal protein L9 [Pseudomonadota bacterium]MBU1711023.1 50S ribosomal protein L9 [Pseudomonadota bacterium]
MEVILKETIDTLGQEGDLVKVKPGFGRNYLIPQKKAVLASKANIARLEQEKTTIESRRKSDREQAEALAKKISRLNIVIEQRVGDENKLFGSVTSADIAEKLAELDVIIDKRKILLDEPIKTIGETIVTIKVGYQVNAEVKVEIVPLAAD